MKWFFDQEENVACLTTKKVLYENYPILTVIHYSDDNSWAFLCGTTNENTDAAVISMGEAVKIDNTINDISDLKPGWVANRKSKLSPWVKQKEDSEKI